jgi:hypothetical protein
MRSVAFLLGLLAHDAPAFVTAEDLGSPHGDAIGKWQALGFIDREPGMHPHPSCPHCAEGVPYRAEGRLVCSACRTALDDRALLAWPVRREAFVASLADHLGLRDEVGAIDGSLWELGSGRTGGNTVVCFFHAGGPLSESARARLAPYRRVLVLSAVLADSDGPGRWVPLTELFEADGTFARIALPDLLRDRGPVCFDHETGVLRVGTALAGEVPTGSREWAMLACLAEQADQFVSYRELKREVLRQTGGSGGTEEATFCQKLKSRIKEKYVPGIDRLVVTTNKGDGYRLRAEGEL